MSEFERSNGNIFADIGDPEAKQTLVRAQIMSHILDIILEQELTEIEAAKILGISTLEIADLINGKLSQFSLEKLFQILKVMLIQKLNSCAEFMAGDSTRLRELLHPDKQSIELRYSLAHATLPVGETSTPHSLTTSEVYYILSGKGEMHIDDEIQIVESGDAVYIPPNAKQYIHSCGTEPLVFICIVDPAWRKEDETVYEF